MTELFDQVKKESDKKILIESTANQMRTFVCASISTLDMVLYILLSGLPSPSGQGHRWVRIQNRIMTSNYHTMTWARWDAVSEDVKYFEEKLMTLSGRKMIVSGVLKGNHNTTIHFYIDI